MNFRLRLAIVLGLLSSVSVMPFSNFVAADPYIYWGTADGYGIDLIVNLTSPANSSLFTSGNIPLTFTVGIQNHYENLKITNVVCCGLAE